LKNITKKGGLADFVIKGRRGGEYSIPKKILQKRGRKRLKETAHNTLEIGYTKKRTGF